MHCIFSTQLTLKLSPLPKKEFFFTYTLHKNCMFCENLNELYTKIRGNPTKIVTVTHMKHLHFVKYKLSTDPSYFGKKTARLGH
jgi:hypothetical protein